MKTQVLSYHFARKACARMGSSLLASIFVAVLVLTGMQNIPQAEGHFANHSFTTINPTVGQIFTLNVFLVTDALGGGGVEIATHGIDINNTNLAIIGLTGSVPPGYSCTATACGGVIQNSTGYNFGITIRADNAGTTSFFGTSSGSGSFPSQTFPLESNYPFTQVITIDPANDGPIYSGDGNQGGGFTRGDNHNNTGDGALNQVMQVDIFDNTINIASVVFSACDADITPTFVTAPAGDTTETVQFTTSWAENESSTAGQTPGAPRVCTVEATDDLGAMTSQQVVFEAVDLPASLSAAPATLSGSGGTSTITVLDPDDDGETKSIAVAVNGTVLAGGAPASVVLDGSGQATFPINITVPTPALKADGTVSVSVPGEGAVSIQVGDEGGRGRPGWGFGGIQEFVDEVAEVVNEVVNEAVELAISCTTEPCPEFVRNANKSKKAVEELTKNSDLYPLNGIGMPIGPVFANQGIYTFRSIEHRWQLAKEYLEKLAVEFEIMTSGDECQDCFEVPCLPCNVDSTALQTLQAQMTKLKQEFAYTKLRLGTSAFRIKGDTTQGLRKRLDEEKKQIEQKEKLIKEESDHILKLLFECNNMAIRYGIDLCPIDGNKELEDGPDIVPEPPPIEKVSCEECAHIYTAALVIYWDYYIPHIKKMKDKYKLPSELKKSPFKKDQKKAAKMLAMLNKLVARYNKCAEKIKSLECPKKKPFVNQYDVCTDVCDPYVAGFNEFVNNLCEKIGGDEKKIRQQIRDAKKLKGKLEGLKKGPNKAQKSKDKYLDKINRALEDWGAESARLTGLDLDGKLNRSGQQRRQKVDEAIEKAENLQEEVEAQKEKIQEELDGLQEKIDNLNDLIEKLEGKLNTSKLKKEYNDRADEVDLCVLPKAKGGLGYPCSGQSPGPFEDLCPEKEDGSGEAGDGGDKAGGPDKVGGKDEDEEGGENKGGENKDGEDKEGGDKDGGDKDGGDKAGGDKDGGDKGGSQTGGGGVPQPLPSPNPPRPLPYPPTNDEMAAATHLKNKAKKSNTTEQVEDEKGDETADKDEEGASGTTTGDSTQPDKAPDKPNPEDKDKGTSTTDDIPGKKPDTTGGTHGSATENCDRAKATLGTIFKDCFKNLNSANIDRIINEGKADDLSNIRQTSEKGRGSGDESGVGRHYDDVKGVADGFLDSLQNQKVEDFKGFGSTKALDALKTMFPKPDDRNQEQWDRVLDKALVILDDVHSFGDGTQGSRNSGKSFDDCLKAYLSKIAQSCPQIPGSQFSSTVGDGEKTVTKPSEPTEQDIQEKTKRDLENLALDICGNSYREALRNEKIKQRDAFIKSGGGTSIRSLDAEIDQLNTDIGKNKNSVSPDICSNGDIQCWAGSFARKRNLEQAIASAGDGTRAQNSFIEALKNLNTHLNEKCPQKSLSCDQLYDYLGHLESSNKNSNQFYEQEQQGVSDSLKSMNCPGRQTVKNTDGSTTHTYKDNEGNVTKTVTKYSDGKERIVSVNPDGSTNDITTEVKDGVRTRTIIVTDASGKVIEEVSETETTNDDGSTTVVRKNLVPGTTTVISEEKVTKEKTGTTVRTTTHDHPDKPGVTVRVTSTTDREGNKETVTSVVDKDGKVTSTDKVLAPGNCTEEIKSMYDSYVKLVERANNAGENLSMSARAEIAKVQEQNRADLDRMTKYGFCGPVPSFNVPCPNSCSKNDPVIKKLQELTHQYNNPPSGMRDRDIESYKSVIQAAIAEHLSTTTNKPALNTFYSCLKNMKSIQESSPQGAQDPLISQCSFPSISLPPGVTYTPVAASVRKRVQPNSKEAAFDGTVVTEPDGSTKTYQKKSETNIIVYGSDGKKTTIDGKTTEKDDPKDSSKKVETHTITRTEESGSTERGTKRTKTTTTTHEGGEMESTDTDVNVVGGTRVKTVEVDKAPGKPIIRTTREGSKTTVEYFSSESKMNENKPDYVESTVEGKDECDSCKDVNVDIANGYSQWQKNLKNLYSGELEYTRGDGTKAKVIPPRDSDGKPGMRKQIDSADSALRDAQNSFTNAKTEKDRLAASKARDAALDNLKNLGRANQESYDVAQQIFDNYEAWQKNLERIDGGKEALEKLKKCHSLVKAGKCLVNKVGRDGKIIRDSQGKAIKVPPLSCDSDPNCVFGPEDHMENANKSEFLGDYTGSFSGPGGHYSDGTERRWVEDPQKRTERLAKENSGETEKTNPANVEVSQGPGGVKIIKVTKGDVVETTEEHPNGEVVVKKSVKNDKGEPVVQRVEKPDFTFEETTWTRDRYKGVIVSKKVTNRKGKTTEVFNRTQDTKGNFTEVFRDENTGKVISQREGKRETYSDGSTINSDGGIQIVEKNEKGEITNSYTEISTTDGGTVQLTHTKKSDELTVEDGEYYLKSGTGNEPVYKDGFLTKVKLTDGRTLNIDENGKVESILESNGENISLAPRVSRPACETLVSYITFDSYVTDAVIAQAREAGARVESENIARVGNQKANAVITDDPRYKPIYDEGQRVSKAMKEYTELQQQIRNSSDETSPNSSELIAKLMDHLDNNENFKHFPSLRQMIKEVESRSRGRVFKRVKTENPDENKFVEGDSKIIDCPQNTFTTKSGTITIQRGINSNIGGTSTFIPTTLDGKPTGSFQPTAQPLRVNQAQLVSGVSNTCKYPFASTGSEEDRFKKIQEESNKLADEMMTADPSLDRDEVVSAAIGMYVSWGEIQNIKKADDDARDTIEDFEESQVENPKVWEALQNKHGKCSQSYQTSAGTVQIKSVEVNRSSAPTVKTQPSEFTINVTKIESVADSKPCDLGKALLQMRQIALNPSAKAEVRQQIFSLIKPLEEALKKQEQIQQEQNKSALDARINEYFKYLQSQPSLLKMLMGLHKKDMDAGKCSLFAFNSERYGTQKASISITKPVEDPKKVESLALDRNDPCVKQVDSEVYQEHVQDLSSLKEVEIMDRLRSDKFSNDAQEDLENIRKGKEQNVKDQQWNDLVKEKAQVDAAMASYKRLTTALSQTNKEQNSARFDEILREIQDLFAENKDFKQFPSLQELVNTAENFGRGRECSISGESYFQTANGVIKITWPKNIRSSRSQCLPTGQVGPVSQFLAAYYKELAKGGEADKNKSNLIFDEIFKEMKATMNFTDDQLQAIRNEFNNIKDQESK